MLPFASPRSAEAAECTKLAQAIPLRAARLCHFAVDCQNVQEWSGVSVAMPVIIAVYVSRFSLLIDSATIVTTSGNFFCGRNRNFLYKCCR
jgi:hypothetical protein